MSQKQDRVIASLELITAAIERREPGDALIHCGCSPHYKPDILVTSEWMLTEFPDAPVTSETESHAHYAVDDGAVVWTCCVPHD